MTVKRSAKIGVQYLRPNTKNKKHNCATAIFSRTFSTASNKGFFLMNARLSKPGLFQTNLAVQDRRSPKNNVESPFYEGTDSDFEGTPLFLTFIRLSKKLVLDKSDI